MYTRTAMDLQNKREVPWIFEFGVPSGKLSHNYGKSPFLMGKSTINGHFQ